MKFITITPIWYNSTTNVYQNQDSKITIAVDAIACAKMWFNSCSHCDEMSTTDNYKCPHCGEVK